MLGMTVDQLWGSAGEASPAAYEQLPGGIHKAFSRICASLMPSKALSSALPGAPHPPFRQFVTQYSGWREKMGFLTVTRKPREAGHSLSGSHFPLQDKSQARKVFLGTELGHLRGVVTQVK